VSKFVGKFRKNQDYNEDYDYARNFLHSKKRRNEHSEVKKKLKEWEEENLDKIEISQDEKN
jgi:hypothetical protein